MYRKKKSGMDSPCGKNFQKRNALNKNGISGAFLAEELKNPIVSPVSLASPDSIPPFLISSLPSSQRIQTCVYLLQRNLFFLGEFEKAYSRFDRDSPSYM